MGLNILKKKIPLIIRTLVLFITLSGLVFSFTSSPKIKAQCAANGPQVIQVENGLISAPTLAPFKAGTDVSCVGDTQRAVIPQFAIQSYAEMKTLYYDQITCTNCKTKITAATSTQNIPSYPINLQ
jgi:hypothetical protein